MKLYDSLGWPRPKTGEDEKEKGVQLTEFLWRGTSSSNVEYHHRE
jgi:hypothetical protein